MTTLDLRALIFDLDGVIADTIGLHYRAWQRLSHEENIPFTDEQYHQMQGLPRRQSLAVFLNGRPLPEPTAQAWMDRKNGYFHELLQGFTAADCKPGAMALVQEAKAAGLKIGLGSSSQNAQQVLGKLGLTPYFEVVADGATVQNNKPAPDIFLWVARNLGVQPEHAVVFEDSEAGMQAALTGGFWAVGIGAAHGDGAHWAVESLAQVNLSALRNHLAERKPSP